ncbi:unnamed protein product [Effrenium voratum]|uniref:Arp2/3 complex 41 kDa subunit n=1 Tax=Effrenium voratum TaxID=2562239 RepID=A0AA36MSQ1_9DINO|nr:unnamed protein product [Effrenium voratum]CAJ1384390.1 unnamed protein product [Effrenium voratum]CAJ1434753.1 unnamed protein product [Effrenium voratum]
MPSASLVRRLEEPDIEVVSCHALSADEQLLALCPNSEDIVIFRLVSEKYQRVAVLSKHSQRVSGLDWSCHGRLLSVSEDRTAFVWEQDSQGTWRSSNVELKAPRAALCAAWAPDGERFAVGLSSKDTALCHWEPEVSCWVAWKVGKSKAAITAVAWHSSSQYLATGSTDRHCMVYDVSLAEEGRSPSFGTPQVTEDAAAWINAIAFSNGNVLAFACQDATLRFKALSGGRDAPVQLLRWRGLPFLCLAFVGRSQLVACGFDYVPVLFLQNEGTWQVAGSLDAGPATPSAASGMRDSFDEARKRFRGSTSGKVDATSSWHSNTITSCCPLGDGRFSTSALDGTVLVWEVS